MPKGLLLYNLLYIIDQKFIISICSSINNFCFNRALSQLCISISSAAAIEHFSPRLFSTSNENTSGSNSLRIHPNSANLPLLSPVSSENHDSNPSCKTKFLLFHLLNFPHLCNSPKQLSVPTSSIKL